MSTTDHYAEAERLLAAEHRNDESAALAYAAAQVHATLATVQRGMSVGTLSVDLAPADSPGYLSIPWPPSDELVERVARTLANSNEYSESNWHAWQNDARAVLDAIGAGDE